MKAVSEDKKIILVRPPLKWAGGKYRILQRIKEVLPSGTRFIEPFVGSGVVFLNVDYKRYLLNDVNDDLLLFYKTLKSDGKDFIKYAKRYFTEKNNTKEAFFRLRKTFNQTTDNRRRAALFLYMNKHGYNGLCRYNSSGEFNVPFGRYKKPYFPERELTLFADKSKRASFQCKDFEEVMMQAKAGDVVYCDPPYVPLSDTSYFTAYSSGGFTQYDQVRLAECAKRISERGASVLLSNHFTDFINETYKGAEISVFPVRRLISCDGANRAEIQEILALFGGRQADD